MNEQTSLLNSGQNFNPDSIKAAEDSSMKFVNKKTFKITDLKEFVWNKYYF